MSRLHEWASALPPLPEKLLVGLSGGADSVALVHMLACLREERRLTLWAVHVNHGLRGEASDGDEAFVRAMCAQLSLPLLVYQAQPGAHSGEDWARQARYGFYRQAVEETGAQAVALAHHRDDQAETLLLHLLRGTGLEGLGGMAQEGEVLGVRVIRPLLTVSRQFLREMLLEEGLSWREDASNQDTRYLRNALRNQVMPLLESLAPRAGERMAQTALLLQADARYLAGQEEAFLAAHSGPRWMVLAPLRTLESGMRNRVLRRWWANAHGAGMKEHGLSFQQSQVLVQLAQGPAGSRCNLPGGWHGYCGWTHVHLLEPEETITAFPVELVQETSVNGPGDGVLCQTVPRDMLAQCQVRTWRRGDWIRPFGSRGRQSMQDYWVNRHVDAPFRKGIPLWCRGSEVLLAAGVGAGDIPPMNDTQEMVSLCWRGDMPWLQAKR